VDGEPPALPEPLPDAVAPADAGADEAGVPESGDAAEPADAPVPDEPSDGGDPYGPDEDYEDEPPPAEPTHSEHPVASYVLRVNGADRPVTDAWLGESLLYVLRERLGLAGAKDGCEQGECGACSVQVDGRLVASCLVPAATAAGSEVRTVEGLSTGGGPCEIQRALADCGAVQCGFCIPGMAMTVHDLLEGNHRPTDLETRHALSGNLCRCSGYRGVVEAVRQVVAARDGEDGPPAASRIPAQSGPSSPEAAV
jgi:aerobic-type carbon monoxide dehydrogenase small subunit (CoxS/CutS family)